MISGRSIFYSHVYGLSPTRGRFDNRRSDFFGVYRGYGGFRRLRHVSFNGPPFRRVACVSAAAGVTPPRCVSCSLYHRIMDGMRFLSPACSGSLALVGVSSTPPPGAVHHRCFQPGSQIFRAQPFRPFQTVPNSWKFQFPASSFEPLSQGPQRANPARHRFTATVKSLRPQHNEADNEH